MSGGQGVEVALREKQRAEREGPVFRIPGEGGLGDWGGLFAFLS